MFRIYHGRRFVVLGILVLCFTPTLSWSLEDPTRPPSHTARQVARAVAAVPKLSSILRSKHRQIAVLDGRSTSIGKFHGDYEVVGIDRTSVHLRSRTGEKLTLSMDSEKIKKDIK